MPDNDSPAVDVKDILTNPINPFTGKQQNIGVFESKRDWGIYVSQEPSKPNNCITIYDGSSLITMPSVNQPGTDFEFQQPVVQIRIRCVDYPDGYAKIMQCYKAIQNRGPYITTLNKYSAFYAQSLPVSLAEDSNNRSILVVNFMCSRSVLPIS